MRQLQIRGKEASKNDYLALVPDFQAALTQANSLLYELKKLNLNKCNCKSNGDKYKESYKKKYYNKKTDKTYSFQFSLGSKTYVISLYWPKLVRLFMGGSD